MKLIKSEPFDLRRALAILNVLGVGGPFPRSALVCGYELAAAQPSTVVRALLLAFEINERRKLFKIIQFEEFSAYFVLSMHLNFDSNFYYIIFRFCRM